MKKHIIFITTVLAVFSLFSCSAVEPIVTNYGESVHDAVGEYYEKYEILDLVQLEIDGKTTLQNFCIINDTQGGIDIMCISYAKSNDDSDDYIATGEIIADNIELGKVYSTEEVIENTVVEYVVCEETELPDSTLQKEQFKFNGQELYFCITNITDKSTSIG